jgi:ribosomal-protein-alanine N-acetyltransferase
MMATPAVSHDVRIEPGTADQIDAVMRVMDCAFGDRFGEAWTRSQLSGILPMAGVFLTLALDSADESVIGFSLVRTIAGESELLLIGVLPDVQRRGVGARLLDDFLERAGEDDVSRVHLEVRDGNPAIGMYRSAGFSPVGRRRNYYQASDGNRYDAITLSREL